MEQHIFVCILFENIEKYLLIEHVIQIYKCPCQTAYDEEQEQLNLITITVWICPQAPFCYDVVTLLLLLLLS